MKKNGGDKDTVRGKKKEEQPCKQQEEKALAMTPNVTARSFRLFERHIKKNEFLFFFFCFMYFGEDPKQTNHEWGTGKEGRREGRREKGEKRGGSGRRDEKQAESPKGENDAIKNSNHTLTQKHRKDPEKQTNKV